MVSNRQAPTCSIQRTLDVIGDRWTLLILRDLFRGVRRFSRIQVDLGIARNLLAARLASLIDEGIVKRVPYQDRPLRHEYHLTPKGRALSPSLMALMRWGDDYYCDTGPPPVELVHDACETRLELQSWCVKCNSPVSPTHIRAAPGHGSKLVSTEDHEHVR